MLKKIIVIVALLTSVIAVISLYVYLTRNTQIDNGFKRSFLSKQAAYQEQISLDNDRYTIIEVKPNIISMFNYKDPSTVLSISSDLKTMDKNHLPFPSSKNKIEGRNTVAFLDSSYFLLNGKTSMIYRINLPDKKISSNKLDSFYFYQSEVINPNAYVYVSVVHTNGTNRRVLKKKNWQGKELSNYFPDKQTEGIFSTDGQFAYDKKSQKIVYMYYYTGKFTCLDTNLNVICNAKTVDTVKYAKIHFKREKMKINGQTANAISTMNPPRIVNKRMCIDNDKLYINSNIKAGNEVINVFNTPEVIDVYDVKNGKYSHSFYLPKMGGDRLTEFRVFKNKLYGVYRNNLRLFKIPV